MTFRRHAKSPRRLNVPLPTSSTPGRESIFATRISSSRTEPALSGYAISPYSRRQQAYREERALRRDKINARGGLSEHLRAAYAHRQSPPSQGADDVADSDDMDAPPAQDEDVSNAGEQEEEDLLPKPIARGTRQRTRELSVMSDASVVMDDTMASPRRSARIKNKPADDASPVRERKSAKSPPPTTGKRGKRKEAVSELTSDTEMQAGRSSRATSPRRARSPQKSSTINGRAASPAADDQNMTIDQIISPAQPAETPAKEQPGQRGLSAREQRLQSTVGRKSRGFSAKDEGDDIPASSAGVLDQPKLKLPNSVFANRFSFGRSPSSSLLASPVPGTARTEAMSTGAPNVHSGSASDAQSAVLPKLALPSSVSSSSGNANPSTAEHAGKPLNSPKPPSTSPSTSAQIAPAGGSSDAPQTTLPPNKPLFSFTAPSRDPMESSQTPAQQNQAQQQTVQSGNVPTFSFGKASQTKPVNDEAAPASTTPAPFSFGQASNKRKVSFLAFVVYFPLLKVPFDLLQPEEKSSSFTVGKTADATSSPVIPVIDVTKPSNPFAAFPAPISSTPTASEQETSSTNTGKPAFSFGQKTNAPAVSSGEKGEGASTPAASTITTTPAFTFGAASSPAPVVVGDNTKAPDAQGMQASPPPAIDNDKPANAPFSPVVQPSKPPAFSFGPPASSSSTGPATATQTPAFTFGTQAANQGETKSRSASPFSVGAPAQPFTFGASDAAKPATPAFSFGAPKPESKANDKPTSSTGFTFGSGTPAASAASTPAFSFGAPKPASSNPFAAAPNMQASGSAFGATTPAVANSTQSAPAFGQSTTNGSAPTFAFGAPSNAATNNSTPSFTFGAASTPAASNPPAFSFGAANAATTSQPFVFGGGSATGAPTPPASSAAAVPSFNFSAASAPGSQPVSPALTPSGLEQSGGSFFTIGAGDTPSSPNKPRRPVKPLRRPR